MLGAARMRGGGQVRTTKQGQHARHQWHQLRHQRHATPASANVEACTSSTVAGTAHAPRRPLPLLSVSTHRGSSLDGALPRLRQARDARCVNGNCGHERHRAHASHHGRRGHAHERRRLAGRLHASMLACEAHGGAGGGAGKLGQHDVGRGGVGGWWWWGWWLGNNQQGPVCVCVCACVWAKR